jgi:hypothetical protein
MNELKHTSIIGGILSIADESEPLAEKKNPALAAAIGFVSGGIGLGLYLRSWRDFLIPFGILFAVLVLGVVTVEVLSLATPFIWATYGYRRVIASNEKLERRGGREIVEAETVTVSLPMIQLPMQAQAPAESRLRQIDDLFQKGFLTPAERDEKRRHVLGEL